MSAISINKSSIAKSAVLAGLGFMITQAILALVWRRLLLGDIYAGTNFYDVTEPTPGIFIQSLSFYFLTGLVLSLLFAHMVTSRGSGPMPSATRYALLTGIAYWLIHDYSYIGRHDVVGVGLYLALEAVLVVLIFAVYSQILKRVFREW